MHMERRDFLNTFGKGALAVAALGVTAAACDSGGDDSGDGGSGTEAATTQVALQDDALPEVRWQMPTSWPLGLDTLYGGAVVFADTVRRLTRGRFDITPRPVGEIVGGTEVLDAVRDGAVPIGHTASDHSIALSPAVAFGTALPFGLTDRQQNAWLFEGGGLDLLQRFYADRFGLIQFPAGNTGVQMGGWYNKEIDSVADLQGLTMRHTGLGGQVMERLGVTVELLAGDEIFEALRTGAVDAAEWVGPHDDTKLALQEAASFYYYPGWWKPGPSLEVQIALGAWNNLPEEYQEAVKAAAHTANTIMMARYDALNPPAFQQILASDVQVLPFPEDVMRAAEEESFALYDELAAGDADFGTILTPWMEFRSAIQDWHATAEKAMLDFGALER